MLSTVLWRHVFPILTRTGDDLHSTSAILRVAHYLYGKTAVRLGDLDFSTEVLTLPAFLSKSVHWLQLGVEMAVYRPINPLLPTKMN